MTLNIDPRQVWRNWTVDGVPASLPWEPRKAEIRQLLHGWWQTLIGLAAEAGEFELPNLMISWEITGGDANDILADPSSEDYSPGSQLHMIVFQAPNTGDMTLNATPLRLNDGQEIPPAYFPANVAALFRQTDTEWRLLTFGDPESVAAAVESSLALAQAWAEGTEPGGPGTKSSREWAEEAEAIVGFDGTAATVSYDNTSSGLAAGNVQAAIDELAGGNGVAADLTELRALFDGPVAVAVLTDGGRSGTFLKRTSDVSNDILGAAINSSAVDAGTDTITSADHRLATGYAVIVTATVNGASANTIYYVRRGSSSTLTLHSTLAGAHANTGKVDLTGTSAMTLRRHHDPRSAVHVTPTSDITGASGAWVRLGVERINVRWAGALSDAVADDTAAIQGAIDIAEHSGINRGRQVYFPRGAPGGWHVISHPLALTKPIHFVGESRDCSIIYAAAGWAGNAPMFRVHGDYVTNLENVKFENMMLFSNSTDRADGIQFDRTAHIVVRDVIIRHCRVGVRLSGNRSFSNYFENLECTYCSVSGFAFGANFEGGGNQVFVRCGFAGGAAYGMLADQTTHLMGVILMGCNFEANGTAGLLIQGTIWGFTITGGNAEKNNGVATLIFEPASGKGQFGVEIHGYAFETDGEAYAIQIGGAGSFGGFSFTGCHARDYATSFVRYTGAGAKAGGVIQANLMNNAATATSNGPGTEVAIGNNRNSGGATT